MECLRRPPAPPVLNFNSLSAGSSRFSRNFKVRLISGNGEGRLLPLSSLYLKKSTICAAKRDPNKKKADPHSFNHSPDETIFPEAVLLKEKKVEEDGRLLPEFADAEEREAFESLMLELESDLDAERMRHYEVVYLIHEDHKDEVESVNQKVQEFLNEKKGRVYRFSDWGMRRLAYKIQKAKNAHYILMNFEIDSKWINDFKSLLDKDERVIRHLVMKQDKAETEDCPPPPEFHTLRAGTDDEGDEDLDFDDEYDEEDDYEDDGEEDMDDETDIDMDRESMGRGKQKVAV